MRAFRWCIAHANGKYARQVISIQNLCHAWVISMTIHFLYPKIGVSAWSFWNFFLQVKIRYLRQPLFKFSQQLTLWRPAAFRDFRKKKRLNARGFAREFLWSGMLYRPGKSPKRHGKSSSLHSKKYFLLGGCGFFVSDVISGGLLGHLGPLCLVLGANR